VRPLCFEPLLDQVVELRRPDEVQIWPELRVEVGDAALEAGDVPRQEGLVGRRGELEGADGGGRLRGGRAPVAAEEQVHGRAVRRHGRRGTQPALEGGAQDLEDPEEERVLAELEGEVQHAAPPQRAQAEDELVLQDLHLARGDMGEI